VRVHSTSTPEEETMQNQVPGWVKTRAAGIGYCSHGQHFTEDGDTVWAYFVSPIKSTERVCDECAKKVLSGE
jgi:hypothetical protein